MFGLFDGKPAAPAPDQEQGTPAEVSAMIEAFFSKIGMNAHQQQIRTNNGVGWTVMRGSAIVYILVLPSDMGPLLRIVSPIVYMPAQNLVPFYRKLLDVNSGLVECALAMDKDVVICVSTRPTRGLGQDELDELISLVSGAADGLDHELNKEFGARVYSQEPQ